MIISTKHLPRDLRLIGIFAFIFALLQFGGVIDGTRIYIASFIIYLSSGIIYFSLATGASRNENWAWLSGLVIFIWSIVSGLISILLKWISPFSLVIALLIPVLFLITFIQAKKEIAINSKISLLPFTFLIIGLIMNIISNGYVFYLVTHLLY
jgi:hypothetical protein